MESQRNRGLLIALSVFAVCLGVAELLLRALGFQPWLPEAPATRVEPGGRIFEIDTVTGYRNLAGRFEIEFPRTGYRGTATHTADGSRITSFPDAAPLGRPEVWFFGSSFTCGWSLDDEETFPWLVQAQPPSKRILNFGVGAYGTLDSLLQFREARAVRAAPPELVMVV